MNDKQLPWMQLPYKAVKRKPRNIRAITPAPIKNWIRKQEFGLLPQFVFGRTPKDTVFVLYETDF